MSFLQELLTEMATEGFYNAFKWLGISIKWLFYLGKKPIATIKQENWNRRIGLIFIVFFIYYKNK